VSGGGRLAGWGIDPVGVGGHRGGGGRLGTSTTAIPDDRLLQRSFLTTDCVESPQYHVLHSVRLRTISDASSYTRRRQDFPTASFLCLGEVEVMEYQAMPPRHSEFPTCRVAFDGRTRAHGMGGTKRGLPLMRHWCRRDVQICKCTVVLERLAFNTATPPPPLPSPLHPLLSLISPWKDRPFAHTSLIPSSAV
jgi:hypothetical protein